MDFIRISFQKMCKAMPGGWSAMAAAMGLSLPNLENRVYNRRNQAMDVHEALQLQEFSGTTLFAEAVAQVSGGVFIPMPAMGKIDQSEIGQIYMELVEEVGKLAREWREATRDGEVDPKERQRMEEVRAAICTKVTQMNHLTFEVFCKDAKQ